VKIPRLTSQQLDPVTGRIEWPTALEAKEFDTERVALDNLFTLRAANPAAVTHTQVEKLTDSLRDKLDAEHDHLSTPDFFAARHFLESVDGESRYTGMESHPDVAGIK
jgi:hypothetical protein